MRLLVFEAIVATLVYGQDSGNIMEGPVVDLGYARFRGSTNSDGVTSFLGIPYAAPPIGILGTRVSLTARESSISSPSTTDYGQLQHHRCHQLWQPVSPGFSQ